MQTGTSIMSDCLKVDRTNLTTSICLDIFHKKYPVLFKQLILILHVYPGKYQEVIIIKQWQLLQISRLTCRSSNHQLIHYTQQLQG